MYAVVSVRVMASGQRFGQAPRQYPLWIFRSRHSSFFVLLLGG